MEAIEQIAQAVEVAGGRAFVVGGAVRDELLGLPVKDMDLEVYGLSPEKLEAVLTRARFKVKTVGRAFAVFKVVTEAGDIDIAIPRRERKVGRGHRGFEVEYDPELLPEQAVKRRDFTINALLNDPLTGEIFDYVGGQKDLKEKILRACDPKHFGEDPLRALRAMQLAARFDMSVEPKTQTLIKKLLPSLEELPRERVGEEWRKLLLKADRPSIGLKLGLELGILQTLHPAVAVMNDAPQEADWHPEGNVFEHILIVVDEAVKITRDRRLDEGTRVTILLGALLHDIGKPPTTKKIDGRIRSKGHSEAGVPLAEEFCEQIACDKTTTERVKQLVRFHLLPGIWYDTVNPSPVRKSSHPAQPTSKLGPGAFRRLAHRVAPATLQELGLLALADYYGTKSLDRSVGDLIVGWFLEQAEAAEAAVAPPPRLISGKELIELGFPPGPGFGRIQELVEILHERGLAKDELLRRLKDAGDLTKAAKEFEELLQHEKAPPR